jgi:two-component system NtrC family sensor kinase
MKIFSSVENAARDFLNIPESVTSPQRYKVLRRNITLLMLLVTLIPLFLMAFINYHQYRTAVREEIESPLRVLVNKTKHSFELFLAGRLSAISFVASGFSFDYLSDEKNLNRIFLVLKQEFKGFIDLGLIDSEGNQVSYVGPYQLTGKNYADQGWFQQVRVNGTYISDVFLGHRKFPHVVIAVQHLDGNGKGWIVRATIDTARFDDLIAAMQLDPKSDAFLINQQGTLQTNSKFYGKVFDTCIECVPPMSSDADIIEKTDPKGREVLIAYAYFRDSDYILMLVKPKADVLRTWYTLKSELLWLLIGGTIVIFIVVYRLTKAMVDRMEESENKRELAIREMQHSHKLSSIGRLAAGVAHEINNPMAVINEKAGLIKDLIEMRPDFPDKPKFLGLVSAILQSVSRCRTVTHRLLGFAKRMDTQIELLDVNEVVREVLGFLEKEALHRNIELGLHLATDLSRIASDRGQLQQVFLNILNNAFQAVPDSGKVSIASFEKDIDTVGVTVQDNGHGMSEETLKHIFEPFFTTKKDHGTGLGLSITYGLVKKLGGDIDVQSKEGHGTRFTVYLPKKQPNGIG